MKKKRRALSGQQQAIRDAQSTRAHSRHKYTMSALQPLQAPTMEHGVILFFFSKLNLLLSFSNCLAFEMNLRGAGHVVPFDSEAAVAVASTFGLPELLGTIYDATAVAPGVHENEMILDNF